MSADPPPLINRLNSVGHPKGISINKNLYMDYIPSRVIIKESLFYRKSFLDSFIFFPFPS